MSDEAPPRRGWLERVERVGTALPDPVSRFALLGGAVLAVEALCAVTGGAVQHPKDGS